MNSFSFDFTPQLSVPGSGGTAEIEVNGDVATVTIKTGKGKIVGHGLYRLAPGTTTFTLESGTAWKPNPIWTRLSFYFHWLMTGKRPTPRIEVEGEIRKEE